MLAEVLHSAGRSALKAKSRKMEYGVGSTKTKTACLVLCTGGQKRSEICFYATTPSYASLMPPLLAKKGNVPSVDEGFRKISKDSPK